MQTLDFDNQFTAALPADAQNENFRRQLSNAIYANVEPTPVADPKLLAYSSEAASLIGLTDADCESDEFLQVFAGNKVLSEMHPHATCYGGHQFGNWAGQLGDGRAINLGEVNHGGHHWMLQLKGAGPTPFSRSADGLAVLRSSLREFLCSEAMHHLGIPTTRALSLITSGEDVMRDMLYDGNPALEPGAIVCRMSSSFVRFGHFQILTARGEIDLLKQFTDFVIAREYPDLDTHHFGPRETSDTHNVGGFSDTQTLDEDTQKYVHFFDVVCQRTAKLIVEWMRVGFVHGVMNTDNMSIIGETIDYGPYGWLDNFDPDWTPNTTDAAQRRYRYDQQPAIAQWNLMQLANALLPLIDDPKPLEVSLSNFATHYQSSWQQMMANKLGLNDYDQSLVGGLMKLLTASEVDMTLFYRGLSVFHPSDSQLLPTLYESYYADSVDSSSQNQLHSWTNQYQQKLAQQGIVEEERRRVMQANNPKYILRNYLSQLAIDDAEQGEFQRIATLLNILRNPYTEQPDMQDYAAKRPDWARSRAGCSMLSCSS